MRVRVRKQGLPYALNQAGLPFGLLLLVVVAVITAFICHHNSFLIYGSLERPTLANWSRVTHASVGSALIISAAFAVAGYTTFTGYTQVCASISLAYDCLGVVLVLNGVLSATPLIFIIPSACFIKLSPGRWFRRENVFPTILILIGLLVMIPGLIMTVLYPQDCSHGAEMFYCADANVSGTVPPV
ncbi:putative sodium-coupled neutral amino acid transporter 11 [Liparis tanakae]|uniref:Putative sodium-coupled neutral amino acid transporter 11 n=1 Tax=Liparis tanakae TaxID=230148 RepID=A0A4Z2J305_9TELE|nr:putative sodium-coupled neutral amino acid transporter 11 [Liparis tanakae]